jgi:hypothetical protein
VKAAARDVAVFIQIKRIERFKAGETACIVFKLQFFGGVHVTP